MLPFEEDEFVNEACGDQSGVVFYGQPANGLWIDTLAVSDIYVGPLFGAIWKRSAKAPPSPPAPRLIADWNCHQGWTHAHRIVEISRHEAEELVDALATLSAGELAAQSSVTFPEKALRCATAIRDFLRSCLDRHEPVYIADN